MSQTIITSNTFLHFPPSGPKPHQSPPPIIFFITGNPGLIKYYHDFLRRLCHHHEDSDQPSGSPANGRIVAGFSLGGFEVDLGPRGGPSEGFVRDHDGGGEGDSGGSSNSSSRSSSGDDETLLFPPGFNRKDLYDLRDQIDLCYLRLRALVERVGRVYGGSRCDGRVVQSEDAVDEHDGGLLDVNVVLMGHSVGAYIALEMVRRHYSCCNGRRDEDRKLCSADKSLSSAPSSISSSFSSPTGPGLTSFTIRSAVLLTPTIQNIAHSRSGRVATPLLTYLPFFPGLGQFTSSTLVAVLSTARLEALVSWFTGMAVGSDALAATLEFLRCPAAVRQALYLAGREMREIVDASWSDEVWGVLDKGLRETRVEGTEGDGARDQVGWIVPRLFFWFAKMDHWVADVTREQIVEAVKDRFDSAHIDTDVSLQVATRRTPYEIIVDDEELVHAWCINQSKLVARRVNEWLDDALR